MIEIAMNQIKKEFGFKTILNGVDLEIKTKERVSIIGRNGSGKTTIFNIIAGLEYPDQGFVTIRKDASIGFLEQIPQLTQEKTTVKQVLMGSFSHLIHIEDRMRYLESQMSTADNLDKVMNEYGALQNKYAALDGYAMEEEFSKVVSGFNLDSILEREFNILSGGQKTIVKLAALLLEKPNILFLDEPTNHLDIKTLEWLESFLIKYNGTVVIISHDRYFLDKIITKTILLEDGTCQSFNGNYSFFLKEQERLLMLEFEAYKNQQKQIAAMKEAIKRFRDWGARSDNPKFFKKAKELEQKIEKMEMLSKPVGKKPLPVQFSGERSGKDVLVIKGLRIILGDTLLFEEANAKIYYKERICLFGSNGSGKTTLIRAILGDLLPISGEIKLGESAKIGYIPQEIRFPNDEATVIETFRSDVAMTEGTARNVLSKYFFIGDHVFKKVKMLSGGEKVILKLAILVQQEVNFLILDEPTNHIDLDTRELLEDALLEFKGTLLFVSHDRYFIHKISQRTITIKDYQLC